MEGKGNIADYRRNLDKTLACHNLTNEEILKTLVKNQVLQSSEFQLEECENVVEMRSKELSNFLSMLRSASEISKPNEESPSGWKVKQDTDELRVMYREGPEGTPYHTLLAEGFVNGPIDICLCISYASELYKEWWPQTSIPTFKIASSQCLQRVGTNEQLSLMRMKVSWPMSSREALIQYFVFEYFLDGLIVVVLNSISDSETHPAQEVVRVDMSGGFAIHKVTTHRSFFRTIANMDIKLDFVPPSFINFISRQLIGSGFKLYKEKVASVSKGDVNFAEPLKGPLYTRIREALYSEKESTGSVNLKTSEVNEIVMDAVNEIEEIEEKETDTNQSTGENNRINKMMENFDKRKVGFTPEVDITRQRKGNFGNGANKKVVISQEVEQALDTLEKVISVFREYNINREKVSYVNKGNMKTIENGSVKEPLSSQADHMTGENGNHTDSSKIDSRELISNEARNSSSSRSSRFKASNSYLRESKITPAYPDEENLSNPLHTDSIVKHSSANRITDLTVLEKVTDSFLLNADANGLKGDVKIKRKHKSSWFCCLHVNSGQ